MDRIRILFVDDEAIVRERLKKCIDWEVNGFEVVGAAENGEKALAYLGQLSVNIVVTDIKMPVMDGLELIRNSRESGYDSKFLILSGYDDFQYAQRALRYGADDYILKPIKEEELLDALIRIRDLHFPKQQTTLQLHPQKYSGTVKTIISCVEMNLDQPELSLKQIADEVLFMSGNYLSKLFLKETGYKFSTFLTIKRMEKAAQLLRENCDVTVYEVAERTGFGNNPQYFSTVFKKYFGKSPSELREKSI
ncbi:response regulator transcription factor [Enterocloster sp.]|uniref:response regulator transcription factor n=1 Tax=Enterocloster sp. TaxID=2719315 RepID=UPI003AF0531A